MRSKVAVAAVELGERGVVARVVVVSCSMVVVASWDILVCGVVGAIINTAEVGVNTGVLFFVGVYVFIGGTVEFDGFAFGDLGIGDGGFEGFIGVLVE
jgi:hypothetical protein